MESTKVDWAGEADMNESHGNNDQDACSPNSTGEPKSDGGKRVESDCIVGGTTDGLSDDLPAEDDNSKNIASGNPKVGLVSWGQLLEVRKTKF